MCFKYGEKINFISTENIHDNKRYHINYKNTDYKHNRSSAQNDMGFPLGNSAEGLCVGVGKI